MAEVDLLIKLFDTLRDMTRDIQQLCQAMLTNQTNIGNYVKNLPMEDVREILREHKRESSDEIGACTETIETQGDEIVKEIKLNREEMKEMRSKIKTMIIVVIVAFTLFSTAIMIAEINDDKGSEYQELVEKIESLENQINQKRSSKP